MSLRPKLGDRVGGVVQRCREVVVRARIVGVDDPVLDVPRGVVAPAEPAQPRLPVLLGADSREADDGVSLRVREGRLGRLWEYFSSQQTTRGRTTQALALVRFTDGRRTAPTFMECSRVSWGRSAHGRPLAGWVSTRYHADSRTWSQVSSDVESSGAALGQYGVMETHVRTPFEVFNSPQTLVIPMYQRLYVWKQELQWEPLWADVARLAHAALAGGEPTHFLGAVVIQQLPKSWGEALEKWSIVDGQQRLTTLQLLMDAVAGQLEVLAGSAVGDEAVDLRRLASQLEQCTHNDAKYLRDPRDALKLSHENRDGDAFRAAMDAAPAEPSTAEKDLDRLAEAHAFFASSARAFLVGDPEQASQRAEALTQALRLGVQLVVISLKADEDSQAIFETLNARGTPLTATDLIKNLLFQRLKVEGAEVAEAVRIWEQFDSKFWEAEERVGSSGYPRSALFLRNWLVAELGEEVPQRNLFSRFKRFVDESGLPVAEMVHRLGEAARAFQQILQEARQPTGDLSVPAMFVYRTRATKQQTVDPVLLWLIDPKRHVPATVRDEALETIESWVIRRAFLRLSTSNIAPVVAELIAGLNAGHPDYAASFIVSHLRGLDQETTYWPGDADVRRELAELAVYKRYTRPRLRVLLEAVEDHKRGFSSTSASKTGHRVDRDERPIEHLMPQRWQAHWPISDDANAAVVRQEHIHRLGNLTLLTASLNSSVSNGAWGGVSGKHANLLKHDVYLLNREVRDLGQEGWDEEVIDERTGRMIDALLATWPVPEGHEGQVRNHEKSAGLDWVTVPKLVEAGMLRVGTTLTSTKARAVGKAAKVTRDGGLQIDDEVFQSPSGAAKFAAGSRSEAGWQFWRTPDGRMLDDLRAELVRRRDAQGSV